MIWGCAAYFSFSFSWYLKFASSRCRVYKTNPEINHPDRIRDKVTGEEKFLQDMYLRSPIFESDSLSRSEYPFRRSRRGCTYCLQTMRRMSAFASASWNKLPGCVHPPSRRCGPSCRMSRIQVPSRWGSSPHRSPLKYGPYGLVVAASDFSCQMCTS